MPKGKTKSTKFRFYTGWERDMVIVASIILSLTALFTNFYTWRVVRDLNRSTAFINQLLQNDEFKEILEMEARLNGQLDTFNQGVQSITQQTNDRVSSVQSQLNETTEQLKETTESLNALSDRINEELARMRVDLPLIVNDSVGRALFARSAPSPQSFSGQGVQTTPGTTTLVPSQNNAPVPQGYQRLVGPDGSVTYRKIR